MCGIAAVVGDAAVPEPAIALALTHLSRRGPDGGAAESESGRVLLATRLTQWDEGSPRQPYVATGGDRAVFNGELFNLEALRRDVGLPDAPEVAVLLEGLRRWGPVFLRRIDGQFAVIARLADGTTYAARDRFGICPLFRAGARRGQVFASSLAALFALAAAEPEYDVAGLAAILRDWAPTGGLSPYVGVAQVPPGSVVVIEPGGADHTERWAGPTGAAVGGGDRGECPPGAAMGGVGAGLAELESRLRAAVRVRMRSTGDVACLVSGGIDSTVLASVAVDEGARLGLSLWLDGDNVTRGRQAETAAAAGLDLVQHRLTTAETMATWRDFVATRRLPLVRLGPVGMTALARRARAEGVRTVLSGEGADEVFCGYDSYRLIAARSGLYGAVDALDWARFGAPEMPVGQGPRAHRAYWRGLIAFGAATPTRASILRPVAGLLGPPLAEAMTVAEASGAAPPGSPPATAYPSDPARLLWARRDEDLATLLPAYLLLVQGDQAWAEEGVELRPPYLSALVADWALARDPSEFVSIERGKEPVYALLARLARERPALAGLGFAKSAFRVDARLLLRDAQAYGDLRAAVAECPQDLVDVPGLLHRLDRGRAAGTLSEAESMLTTLAASFGILATT